MIKKISFLLFTLIICYGSVLANQTPYFEKHLDEYSPPLVSDMIPKELLNFKPVSFRFHGTTITEIKAQTRGGVARKTDEKEYGKKLHFEWQVKGQLVSLDYYVVSWENAQAYFGGKKVHPNTYAYLKIIGKKIESVCLGGNCPYLLVETNLIEEHKSCNFYSTPDKIKEPPTIPSYYIYKECTLFDGKPSYKKHIGLWSYANVFIEVNADDLDTVKKIGESAVAKLMGKSILVEKPTNEETKKVSKEEIKKENLFITASVVPSAIGDDTSKTAYLPLTTFLPARITANTKPNTNITFQILKSDGTAYLSSSTSKSDKIEVVSDNRGIASVLFYYKGGQVTLPKKYEIKVTAGEEKDIVTIYVGLGLTFSKITAVDGGYGEKHPFIISVKSTFFPNLPLGVYFNNASEKVWNGYNVGVKIKPEWVNKPANVRSDKVFIGITKISPTPVGATSDNVLTVISYSVLDETIYAYTKYAYPAIKMQSDGIHSYRIIGNLVITDNKGNEYMPLDEQLIQKEVLTIITRERPENALTSLLCAFEATTANQFLMLETIKMIPVFGESVDLISTVTGALCKVNRGEDYGSIFLDLANFLGGQYLDHLYKPEIFNKMTDKMRLGFLVAYVSYKGLDTSKKQKEYEKIKKESNRR